MKYASDFKSDEQLFSHIPPEAPVDVNDKRPPLGIYCRVYMEKFRPGDEMKQIMKNVMGIEEEVKVYDKMGGTNFLPNMQRENDEAINNSLLNMYEECILDHLDKYDGYIGQFPPTEVTCENMLDRAGNKRKIVFGTQQRRIRCVPHHFRELDERFGRITPVERSKTYRRRKLIAVPVILFVLFLLMAKTGCGPILQALFPVQTAENTVVQVIVYALLAATLLGALLIPCLLRETKLTPAGVISYVVTGTILAACVGAEFSTILAEGENVIMLALRLILAAYFLIECVYLLIKILVGRSRERKSEKAHRNNTDSFVKLMEEQKDVYYRYVRLLALWKQQADSLALSMYADAAQRTFEIMYEGYLSGRQAGT